MKRFDGCESKIFLYELQIKQFEWLMNAEAMEMILEKGGQIGLDRFKDMKYK